MSESASRSGDNTASPVLPVQLEKLVIRSHRRCLLDIPQLALADPCCHLVIGPNGAGKSLLVRALAGLLDPDEGRVLWGNAAPKREHRLRVGLLPQRPVLLRRTSRANLIYALRAAGVSRGQARLVADDSLRQAGLESVAATSAQLLSGGEQQRLALARALLLKPDVLLLDEPTASVDPVSTQPIEQMLRSAADAGCCVIMVSHDLGQVRRLADQVLFLHQGRLLEQTPARAFFERANTVEAQRFIRGELLL